MNSFDTIVFKCTIPIFELSKVQCRMVQQSKWDKVKKTNGYYMLFVLDDGLFGIDNVTTPLYYEGMSLDGEMVTVSCTISSKILGKSHHLLINRNTIHLVLEQLQQRLYSGLTIDILEQSVVNIIHVTKDIEMQPNKVEGLRSIQFDTSTGLTSIRYEKSNIVFTNSRTKEPDGLYFTIYNKRTSMRLAVNKSFRNYIDDDYSDKPNVFRMETKLVGRKPIRQRLTNDKWQDDDFGTTRRPPTLADCLRSDEQTIYHDLTYLIEKTMEEIPLRNFANDTERFLMMMMEKYNFDIGTVRAKLISEWSVSTYERKWQTPLQTISKKCKSTKHTYLNELRNMFND